MGIDSRQIGYDIFFKASLSIYQYKHEYIILTVQVMLPIKHAWFLFFLRSSTFSGQEACDGSSYQFHIRISFRWLTILYSTSYKRKNSSIAIYLQWMYLNIKVDNTQTYSSQRLHPTKLMMTVKDQPIW